MGKLFTLTIVVLTISKIMNKALLMSGISISLGSLLFATIMPIQQAKAEYPAGLIIEVGRSKRAVELLKRGGSVEDATAILGGRNPGSKKVAPKSRVIQKKRK